MSSLLTLNTSDRPIGDFLVGLGVQCHPHRKATRRVFSNYLDAGNGLTTGPLPNRIEALFTQGPVTQSDCSQFSHAALLKDKIKASRKPRKILSRQHPTCWPKSKRSPNTCPGRKLAGSTGGFPILWVVASQDVLSRTGMAIPVVSEIRPAARIIRPKTTHTVGDRIAGRSAVGWDTVVSGAGVIAWGVVGCSQSTTDERASDKSSGHGSAPSPTSSPPINIFDCAWGCFGDRKGLADRSCASSAGELGDAGC